MDDYIAQLQADGAACLAAALQYREMGWSPLALCPPSHVAVGKQHAKTCRSPGKAPFGPWKDFQDRIASEAELRAKWERISANVGIALGPVSGLIRIDVDGPGGEALLIEKSAGDLPPTLEFKSGRADGTGRGLLYRIPPEAGDLRTTPEAAGTKAELRIQARGSQTVLPPSRHKDGGLYTWEPGRGPGEIEPAPAPKWVLDELRPGKRRGGGTAAIDLEDLLEGVEEGQRNTSAASYAGYVLKSMGDLTQANTVRLAWSFLKSWNEDNTSPLDEDELRNVFNSILKAESERRRKEDPDVFGQFVAEQIQRSIEAQNATVEHPSHAGHQGDAPTAEATYEPSANGHAPPAGTQGEQNGPPPWHLVIVKSDPPEFRLRSPFWSDSDLLKDGYLLLTAKQIRRWGGQELSICQAAYEQALKVVEPVIKGWAKPDGQLQRLTEAATVVEAPAEAKKPMWILGWLYRYLDAAEPVTLHAATGALAWPSGGRPTRDPSGTWVAFKMSHLKKEIAIAREDFSLRDALRLKLAGAEPGKVDHQRWWKINRDDVRRIGEATCEFTGGASSQDEAPQQVGGGA